MVCPIKTEFPAWSVVVLAVVNISCSPRGWDHSRNGISSWAPSNETENESTAKVMIYKFKSRKWRRRERLRIDEERWGFIFGPCFRWLISTRLSPLCQRHNPNLGWSNHCWLGSAFEAMIHYNSLSYIPSIEEYLKKNGYLRWSGKTGHKMGVS